VSGPDKPKVLDEEWSDERVRSFLFLTPYDSAQNPDYHVLIKAYHAMRAYDFERFLGFFTAENRDINARDEQGGTILDRVSQHRRSGDYAEALRRSGARLSSEL